MTSTLDYVLVYSFPEDSSVISTLTLAGEDLRSTPEFEITVPASKESPVVVKKHGSEIGSFDRKAKAECRVDGKVIERVKGVSTFVFSDGKKYTWGVNKVKQTIELLDESRAVVATFASKTPDPIGKNPESTPPALRISLPSPSSSIVDEIVTTLFYVREHGAKGTSSSTNNVVDCMLNALASVFICAT
ncbi:hypothetical protein PQX77_021629 [Marasmius sp. AFHP31]|nr:hypothetical protein PQX77_021629 [Marasmius sp. AFHP31]